MAFIAPMLAHPLPEGLTIPTEGWVVEEKFDGHRLIVETKDGEVRAWSRYGALRMLPAHLYGALRQLPQGIYDGELVVPGDRSYGVTELTKKDQLCYACFDILESLGQSTVAFPYHERRKLADLAVQHVQEPTVFLPPLQAVGSIAEAYTACHGIWARDGEGVILKSLSALYYPGKRHRSWLKIKQKKSAELTLIGFEEGLLGTHSIFVLQDDAGNVISVKARNGKILEEVTANPKLFLKRRLRIEYQERTPDGSYRHPRMDHWV